MRFADPYASTESVVAMAKMIFSRPSHVLRAMVKLFCFIWKYVSQNDSSWMKGSNCPVFWKYSRISAHVRSSDGSAYILTLGCFMLDALWLTFSGAWCGREMLTAPIRRREEGDISPCPGAFPRAIAKDICRKKAIFDEGP